VRGAALDRRARARLASPWMRTVRIVADRRGRTIPCARSGGSARPGPMSSQKVLPSRM